MYQKLYKSKQFKRFVSLFGLALFVSACHQGCHPQIAEQYAPSGLIVGAVVNAPGRPVLKSFERWRYADQIASRILDSNPELSGSVDSYEYLSRRVGAPLSSLLQSFRLEGDLSERALHAFRHAELRRRYLMMVTILPEEQSFPLKPDIKPVVGQMNREVQDYYDLNRQTILLTAVRVQVYDTVSARMVSSAVIRSDDGGRMLATENSSRKYVGNSLLASISNTVSNALNGSINGAYPKPPKRDDVLERIWTRVAAQLPPDVF